MSTATIQGELWGKQTYDWATIQEPPNKPLWEAMFDGALVGAGSHLLDVGCGAGRASALAAARGINVSELDASEGMIAYAQQRLPDGDFRVGDVQHLPYEDEQFDAVFAANVVQFSDDPVATAREFACVCRPQGRIVAGPLTHQRRSSSGVSSNRSQCSCRFHLLAAGRSSCLRRESSLVSFKQQDST